MKKLAWLLILACGAMLFYAAPNAAAGNLRQQPTPGGPTVTGTPTGPVVMVPDWVNVRSGPHTNYERVGGMIAGQTAPAVGRSPGGDWIQIIYVGAPGDLGWVYAPLVRLDPATATLPIVEAPPLPTPRVTATIDPTLAAQFVNLDSPSERLPTFTPAEPVSYPTFEAATASDGGGGFPPFLAILGLMVVGMFGGLISLLRGR